MIIPLMFNLIWYGPLRIYHQEFSLGPMHTPDWESNPTSYTNYFLHPFTFFLTVTMQNTSMEWRWFLSKWRDCMIFSELTAINQQRWRDRVVSLHIVDINLCSSVTVTGHPVDFTGLHSLLSLLRKLKQFLFTFVQFHLLDTSFLRW